MEERTRSHCARAAADASRQSGDAASAGMEEEAVVPEAGGVEAVKLPQSEAIMEAIIRSTKPLPIGPKDEDVRCCVHFERFLQRLGDRLVPLWKCRWLTFSVLLGSFVARLAIIERHFFAAYVLAIYILNQLLLFISPATEDDELPMSSTSGEYRPFVRALSEFHLWVRGAAATVIALVVSFVDALDMEVDGWALVLYFMLLFGYTMKQQIAHMIQHGYVPWSGSKKAARQKDKKSEAYDV